jgi:1-acyl-sn-glycerol-3-phosphate acyltransferase
LADGQHAEAPRPPWAWRLAVTAVRWFLGVLFGWRVVATRPAHTPAPDVPLVVAFHHTSNVDPFVVADVVWRGLGRWCRPLAKAELFDVPLLGTLGRAAGAIPVARGNDAGREQAFDAAVERLVGGAAVMVAPEGTITHDGGVLPLRHGAARMALAAGADVLVVTHLGAQRGFSPVALVPEWGAVVTVGFDLLTPWQDEDAAALTGRIGATMEDRLDALRASHPQRDPDAAWWPPYRAPGTPTATARENLERYREAMGNSIADARARMARFAEHLPDRLRSDRHEETP